MQSTHLQHAIREGCPNMATFPCEKRSLLKPGAGILLLMILLLNGCAFDVIRVRQEPCKMEKDEAASRSFRLGKKTEITLDTGYTRTLKEGARWDFVGVIPQGDVFKTSDQVFTIEGSNIFEAYIVVSSGKLVGFYLPVENSFSPLSEPLPLEMNELNDVQSVDERGSR